MTNSLMDLGGTVINKPNTEEDFFSQIGAIPIDKDEKSTRENILDYLNLASQGVLENVYGAGEFVFDTLGAKKLVPESIREMVPSREEFVEQVKEQFPTEAKTYPQKVVKEAASLLSPGVGLGKTVLAAALGEGVEELGLPEWTKPVAELGVLLSPSGRKLPKIQPKDSETRKLIEEGRKLGLSEKDLSILAQPEYKQKLLQPFLGKGKKALEPLKKTEEAIGNVYSSIQQSPLSSNRLLGTEIGQPLERFSSKMYERFQKLPEAVRSATLEDFKDLMRSDFSGNSLINYAQDIGNAIKNNKDIDGIKKLTQLKNTIKEFLPFISPEIAKDYKVADSLYSKWANIRNSFNANKFYKAVDYAGLSTVAGSLLYGLSTGNYSSFENALKGVGVLSGARALGTQLLTNPRYQNLAKQLNSSLNNNKYGAANVVVKSIVNQMKKDRVDPKVITEFDSIDFTK